MHILYYIDETYNMDIEKKGLGYFPPIIVVIGLVL
jgi:hypothetical protein